MLFEKLIVTIIFVSITVNSAEQRFTCPNQGKPKINSNGNLIQCLPGQTSFCGKGFSCYFSGYNYHCCPTNDDDEYNKQNSKLHIGQQHKNDFENNNNPIETAVCPDETFMVLNSKGNPIQCNLNLNKCPEKAMFCNKHSPVPVCCESISIQTIKITNSKNLNKEIQGQQISQIQDSNQQEPQIQDSNQQILQNQDFNQQITQIQDSNQQEPQIQDSNQQEPQIQDSNQQEPQIQDSNQQEPQIQDSKQQIPQIQYSNQQIPQNQDFNQQIPQIQDSNQQIPQNQDFNQQIPQIQDSNQQIPQNQDSNHQIPQTQDSNQQISQTQDSNQQIQENHYIKEKINSKEKVESIDKNFTGTIVVNRDISINGECTINSVIVMNDKGKPITCDLNKKCPLDSLLCHKVNNGKSYCCQIVPGFETKELNPIVKKKIDDNITTFVDEIKKEEELNEQTTKLPSEFKPPITQNNVVTKNIQIGQAPAARPNDEIILLNNKNVNKTKSEFEQINRLQVDNENKFNVNSTTSLLKKLHIVQHSVKTFNENNKNSHEGYATKEKLEQKSDNNHKQAAQRFILEQIKSGWPYDDRYYHTENVVTINEGDHSASIVHFPN